MSSEDADVLDSLLDKLRSGATIGRKARRSKVDKTISPPLDLEVDGDAADIARDMLARLKSSGFETIASPTMPSAPRRARSRPRRRMSNTSYPPSPNLVLVEVEDEASTEEDE